MLHRIRPMPPPNDERIAAAGSWWLRHATRLGRRMTLPTASFVGGTLTDAKDLVETLMVDLAVLCGDGRAIKLASTGA